MIRLAAISPFWINNFHRIQMNVSKYIFKIFVIFFIKTPLTKVFPCARLIFAYDEGEDIVDKTGGE